MLKKIIEESEFWVFGLREAEEYEYPYDEDMHIWLREELDVDPNSDDLDGAITHALKFILPNTCILSVGTVDTQEMIGMRLLYEMAFASQSWSKKQRRMNFFSSLFLIAVIKPCFLPFAKFWPLLYNKQ